MFNMLRALTEKVENIEQVSNISREINTLGKNQEKMLESCCIRVPPYDLI